MKKGNIKILISGWYGNTNIGDEAILQSMINEFRNELNAEVTVLSDNPVYTMNSQKTKAFWQLPVKGINVFRAIIQLRLLPTIKAIRDCDIFVMGGGGFLSDWQREVPFGWLKQIIVAKFYKKETMLYGIGAGPFNTKEGRLITKFIINKYVDKVTVRDETSKEWLLKCGVDVNKVEVTGDPAINMCEVYPEGLISFNIDDKKDNIGIIVTPHLRNQNKQRYLSLRDSLVEYLTKLSKDESKNLFLIPFQNTLDYDYCYELIRRSEVKATVLSCPGDHLLINNLLSNMDLVVSLRLHGNILSASQGVPFIPIIYHHKTYEFCKRFGWEWFLEFGEGINWREVDLDVEKLIRLTNYFLKEKKFLIEKISLNLREYKKNEKKNIFALKRLIRGE